jgi:hypothetical protein
MYKNEASLVWSQDSDPPGLSFNGNILGVGVDSADLDDKWADAFVRVAREWESAALGQTWETINLEFAARKFPYYILNVVGVEPGTSPTHLRSYLDGLIAAVNAVAARPTPPSGLQARLPRPEDGEPLSVGARRPPKPHVAVLAADVVVLEGVEPMHGPDRFVSIGQ